MTKKILYISSEVNTSFTATDGSNFETVPAAEVAAGAYGYCMVFYCREDAENWNTTADIREIEIDLEDE